MNNEQRLEAIDALLTTLEEQEDLTTVDMVGVGLSFLASILASLGVEDDDIFSLLEKPIRLGEVMHQSAQEKEGNTKTTKETIH